MQKKIINTAKKLIVDLNCSHILPINCIKKEIRGAKKEDK